MVKDLISLIPFNYRDSVLDAGSGKNKVWYKQFQTSGYKDSGIMCDECEIEDGVDFLLLEKKYNWIIGNPPFSLGWKFLDKATDLAKDGVAFLGNINFINCLNQNRMEQLKIKGFYLSKIHIVSDKRWYGRYYFLIFTKNKNDFISWKKESY